MVLDIALWILAMGLLVMVWMPPSRRPASGVGCALIRLPAGQSRWQRRRPHGEGGLCRRARLGLLLALAVYGDLGGHLMRRPAERPPAARHEGTPR